MKKNSKSENLQFYKPDLSTNSDLPLFSSTISAGFPSPADDFIEQKLDLNELLVQHPSATFYVRANGSSMVNAGIYDGDILIVDRSLQPGNNSIVIGIIDGEFTVKRISKRNGDIYLIPENEQYKEIKIELSMDFKIWGVVTNVIHHL